MFQLAKLTLAIPATSTAAESLLPHTGNTIANRRSPLDADKVNNSLFIKRNTRTLEETYPPAFEHDTKNDLTSIDSTSSTTPNKKIKLMGKAQEANEDSDNEEL